MFAKSVPQVHAEAAALLSGLPQVALKRGVRLGRWDSREDGVTIADGEAGRGVYFFYAHDREMSEHYRDRMNRRRLVETTLPGGRYLVDLTHPKVAAKVCRLLTDYARACGSGQKWAKDSFQRSFWGLTMLAGVMRERLPACAGYIVPHVIPSCSPSKQVVLFEDLPIQQALAA